MGGQLLINLIWLHRDCAVYCALMPKTQTYFIRLVRLVRTVKLICISKSRIVMSSHHAFRPATLRIYHDIDDLTVAFITYIPPLILLFVV